MAITDSTHKYYKFIFIAVLSVCLVVPFSNDIFISGLPAISKHFPGAHTSLILSIGLFGLAIAQPFYGPLLDRFGRRPVLLVGLWIYTLASAQVMLADAFIPLLIGRFLQAVGGCSGIISVFAIVRDSYRQDQLIKATGLIMAMIGVSPTIAPLIGSLVNNVWGWRASFVFLFVAGCVFLLLIQFFFKETLLNKNMNALAWKNILGNYLSLIRQQKFLTYCILSGLSYSILFSYFNISSLFIIEQMHFGLINYGVIIALNAIAIITMANLTPRLAIKITLPKAMQYGFIVIASGGLIMWLLNLYFIPNIYTFMLPMFLTTIGIGMIRPTASAGAMQLAPHQIAGSASAVFNFISFVSGSIATALTAIFISHVAGFGLFIVILGITALIYQRVNN